MTSRKSKKIPGPLYAAAGAGDLAYEKLRELPERVAALRETLPDRVAQVRDRAARLRPVVEDRVRAADLDRLREAARRNVDTVTARAHAAQDRASAVYSDLVARGERVVRTARAEDSTTVIPSEPRLEQASAASAVAAAETVVIDADAAVTDTEVSTSTKPAAKRTSTRRGAAKPATPTEPESPAE